MPDFKPPPCLLPIRILQSPPQTYDRYPEEGISALSIRRGFPKLLCGPSVCGIACHADMDHFARLQFDNEAGDQRTEEEPCDWKKVAGPDVFGMMVQEGGPVLTSSLRCASMPHVLLNGAFANVNAQLE